MSEITDLIARLRATKDCDDEPGRCGYGSGPYCSTHIYNDEFTPILREAATSLESLAALLKRLHGWDMMDAAADGPYWRAEIDKLLAPPPPQEPA